MLLFTKDEEKEESEGEEDSDEEVYEVERVVDYAFCKQSVNITEYRIRYTLWFYMTGNLFSLD